MKAVEETAGMVQPEEALWYLREGKPEDEVGH